MPQMQPELSKEILRRYIERIEKLEEEKRALQADIKQVYDEAKAVGFDAKTMRQIVKIRRMDADDLAEQEALLDTYKAALGMLADTPLGEAAIERVEKPRRRTVSTAPSVEKMAATIASEAALGNHEAQAVLAAAQCGADVMVGTARAIVENRKAEPVDLHAAYTAGANACARGEAEDSCTLDDPRAREMWGTGYREWAERKRRAAA